MTDDRDVKSPPQFSRKSRKTCVDHVFPLRQTCLTLCVCLFLTTTFYYSKLLHRAHLHFVYVCLPMRWHERDHVWANLQSVKSLFFLNVHIQHCPSFGPQQQTCQVRLHYPRCNCTTEWHHWKQLIRLHAASSGATKGLKLLFHLLPQHLLTHFYVLKLSFKQTTWLPC